MKNKKILIITILIIAVGFIFLKDLIPNFKKDKQLNNDLIGRWETVKAVNSKTGKETTNLKEVFGSSYKYGSYLNLNKDGSFTDAIEPITDGSTSTTGKYKIKEDYNQVGDCYIFLTYSDNHKEKLQRVILDNSNTYYLVLDGFINDYQLYLKKTKVY